MSIPKEPAICDIYIDSDGVLADFEAEMRRRGMKADQFKKEPGAYLFLSFIPGAPEALAWLKELDSAGLIRVWILTKTPSKTPYAFSEKVLWYRQYAPWLEDRVILCHDKSLLGVSKDFLIDDRPHKGNADKFRGTFVHFGSDTYPDWTAVSKYLYEKLITLNGTEHAIRFPWQTQVEYD